MQIVITALFSALILFYTFLAMWIMVKGTMTLVRWLSRRVDGGPSRHGRLQTSDLNRGGPPLIEQPMTLKDGMNATYGRDAPPPRYPTRHQGKTPWPSEQVLRTTWSNDNP